MFDLIGNLGLGFATALSPTNLAALLRRLPGRHADRRAARRRADRDHRHAAAAHLQGRSDRRADHARRHLLRRAVRRLDHGDPGQHPGRGDVGRDDARRARNGKKGQAGIALGIAAIASFFAGTVATLVIAAIGAPLTKLALLFGPAEYFGLMVLGLGLGDRAGARLGAQGRHHGRVRLAARDGRHRSRDRPGAPHPGLRGPVRTASILPCWPWACSASPRSCAISRARKRATS